MASFSAGWAGGYGWLVFRTGVALQLGALYQILYGYRVQALWYVSDSRPIEGAPAPPRVRNAADVNPWHFRTNLHYPRGQRKRYVRNDTDRWITVSSPYEGEYGEGLYVRFKVNSYQPERSVLRLSSRAHSPEREDSTAHETLLVAKGQVELADGLARIDPEHVEYQERIATGEEVELTWYIPESVMPRFAQQITVEAIFDPTGDGQAPVPGVEPLTFTFHRPWQPSGGDAFVGIERESSANDGVEGSASVDVN